MFIGTLSAVVLGGASTVGTVSLGYEHGISGAALVFMIGLGLIGLGVLLVEAAREGRRLHGAGADGQALRRLARGSSARRSWPPTR